MQFASAVQVMFFLMLPDTRVMNNFSISGRPRIKPGILVVTGKCIVLFVTMNIAPYFTIWNLLKVTSVLQGDSPITVLTVLRHQSSIIMCVLVLSENKRRSTRYIFTFCSRASAVTISREFLASITASKRLCSAATWGFPCWLPRLRRW